MDRHSEILGTSPSYFKLPHLKPGSLPLTSLCESQYASSIPVKILGVFAVPPFSTVGSLKSLFNILPLGLTRPSLPQPCCSATVTLPTPNSPHKGPFPICPPFKLSSRNPGET